MLPIQDSRVFYENGKFNATCICGRLNSYTTKNNCLKMLKRGSCRHCKKDYRHITESVNIYKNNNGKWCSRCSGCGNEQAYTRKDHAKQSELADWQCRKCVANSNRFSANLPVGNMQRLYNKYRKSANNRKIIWRINIDDFTNSYIGKCALTGWDIDISYANCSASLDRIDSTKGYEIGNIQWVHVMANMCKNKYSQKEFIAMCKAIANKW